MGPYEFASVCIICVTVVVVAMIRAKVEVEAKDDIIHMPFPPNQGTNGRK